MDNMVEEALRLNVKWSLQELSRAINGDGKSGPNPLLKVKVILNKDKDKERVNFEFLSIQWFQSNTGVVSSYGRTEPTTYFTIPQQ